MKLRKYTKIVACVAILSPLFSACESWLDVKPVDKVLEDELYSTEEGFKEALNGVYIELNQSSLYGGDLMFKMVEILAQRYNIGEVGEYKNLILYNYSDDDVRKSIDAIWTNAYSLIMNCNKILENAEKNKEVLSSNNYALIKGESLALRAMLHFDLLRLFGPVYLTNANDISICYNETFSYSASNLLPASKVIEKVLKDLQEAEGLLINDPIITEGPRNSSASDGDNSLRYRTLRLNYYAVQALQARVYLYGQQPQKALELARKLVDVQEKWFPLAEADIIEASNKSRNTVFSTELLFALQNKKRGDIFTNYFSPDLEGTKLLVPSKKNLERVFLEVDDWRYKPLWRVPENGQTQLRCFHKYEKTEVANDYTYFLPMLRISEMFFIVAETTADPVEAKICLNRIRRHRGQNPFGDDETVDIQKNVAGEYEKEFYGEGQLFYYYKRNNTLAIPAGNDGNDIVMDAAKYVLPLPESETDYRN